MKKKLNLLISLCLMSVFATAQMSSIYTKKEQALLHKFKTFLVVDENTGFVLAHKVIKYDVKKKMPLCYFTMYNLDGITDFIPGKACPSVLHSLQSVYSSEEYDWVLEDNAEEEDVFFARNRFIVSRLSKQWIIIIEGEKIIFKNIRSSQFLFVDKDGDYKAVSNFGDATRWKLIHKF